MGWLLISTSSREEPLFLSIRVCASGISLSCLSAEGAETPFFLVMPPRFNSAPYRGRAAEPMLVEAFVPEATEKCRGTGVLHWLAVFDDAQPDASSPGPYEPGAESLLAAVVHDDHVKWPIGRRQRIEWVGDSLYEEAGEVR